MTGRLSLCLLVILAFACQPRFASGNNVFDADTSNTNIFSNNFFNYGVGNNTLSGSAGSLVFTNTSGNFNNSGIVSSADLNTLNGTPLTANDTVSFTFEVLFYTGDIQSGSIGNGIEFGLSPNGTDFRPDNNLLFQTGGRFPNSNLIIGNNFTQFVEPVAGFAITPASLADGFTGRLTADVNGYEFSLENIVDSLDSSITERSYFGIFQGSEFVDNFGGGHIYFGAQTAGSPLAFNFGEVSVSVVPEPSSVFLLGGLGLIGFVRRKR